MVASDGGIFSFGDARFFGSTGGIRLNRPIVDMASAPDGRGYLLAAEDGGVFLFGSAQFYGSAAAACPTAPATGVAMSRTAPGYWITFGDARTYAFSPSSVPPTCAASQRANAAARDFYDRLNAERAARGRPALAWDPALANYASAWSQNMAANGFRHSNIGNMWGIGSYNVIGENIAMGYGSGTTAGTLHVAWMNSSGHRENMLSPQFDSVGIGVFCAAGRQHVGDDIVRAPRRGRARARGRRRAAGQPDRAGRPRLRALLTPAEPAAAACSRRRVAAADAAPHDPASARSPGTTYRSRACAAGVTTDDDAVRDRRELPHRAGWRHGDGEHDSSRVQRTARPRSPRARSIRSRVRRRRSARRDRRRERRGRSSR